MNDRDWCFFVQNVMHIIYHIIYHVHWNILLPLKFKLINNMMYLTDIVTPIISIQIQAMLWRPVKPSPRPESIRYGSLVVLCQSWRWHKKSKKNEGHNIHSQRHVHVFERKEMNIVYLLKIPIVYIVSFLFQSIWKVLGVMGVFQNCSGDAL